MNYKNALIILVLSMFFVVGCQQFLAKSDDYCYAPGKGPGDSSLVGDDTVPLETLPIETDPPDNIKPATTQPVVTTTLSEADNKIPKKEFKEGELVSFPNLAKTDADGDAITYSFTSPLDEKGEWQTKVGDAGEYKVTITASDGKTDIDQDVILVILSDNKPPVLDDIADITIKEGEKVVLNVKATDPEGDEVLISYSGWMTSGEKTTSFDDAGTYKVTVTATDGKAESQKQVAITVENVNRAPSIKEVADLSVKEGEVVSIAAAASDPDGDDVSISYPAPFDKDGKWQTGDGDAGEKTYTIIASDGDLTDSTTVKVTVVSKNKAPVLTLASNDITVEETETVKIEASATDPEGDDVTITYSGWMTSDTKETDYNSAGIYKVTVTATDGVNTVAEDVSITVEDKNRPPEIVI